MAFHISINPSTVPFARVVAVFTVDKVVPTKQKIGAAVVALEEDNRIGRIIAEETCVRN